MTAETQANAADFPPSSLVTNKVSTLATSAKADRDVNTESQASIATSFPVTKMVSTLATSAKASCDMTAETQANTADIATSSLVTDKVSTLATAAEATCDMTTETQANGADIAPSSPVAKKVCTLANSVKAASDPTTKSRPIIAEAIRRQRLQVASVGARRAPFNSADALRLGSFAIKYNPTAKVRTVKVSSVADKQGPRMDSTPTTSAPSQGLGLGLGMGSAQPASLTTVQGLGLIIQPTAAPTSLGDNIGSAQPASLTACQGLGLDLQLDISTILAPGTYMVQNTNVVTKNTTKTIIRAPIQAFQYVRGMYSLPALAVEFPQFSSLAPELRNMIWKLAIPTDHKLVRIKYAASSTNKPHELCDHDTHLPVVAMTCHESYCVILKTFIKISPPFLVRPIYYRPKVDAVLFSCYGVFQIAMAQSNQKEWKNYGVQTFMIDPTNAATHNALVESCPKMPKEDIGNAIKKIHIKLNVTFKAITSALRYFRTLKQVYVIGSTGMIVGQYAQAFNTMVKRMREKEKAQAKKSEIFKKFIEGKGLGKVVAKGLVRRADWTGLEWQEVVAPAPAPATAPAV